MNARTGWWQAAATLACGLIGVQPVLAGAVMDAREPSEKLALVVFEGVPGSDALLGGDFEAGLQETLEAQAREPNRHEVQLATNLCVALLKLGRADEARAHCYEAAEAGVDPRLGATMARRLHAVALVNRGVLSSLQGEAAAAGADFEAARRGFPELGIARSNLQWIGSAPVPVVIVEEER